MDQGTRRVFLLALVAVVVFAGAAALLSGRTTPPDATGPAGATEVVGVIVAVDSQGLGDVRGFTLRQEGGAQLDFVLHALENGAQFPPGHLAQHQATAERVRVWYRVDGNDRLALRLEDAGR